MNTTYKAEQELAVENVFPTAGEDQPRSRAHQADQQPPGTAQSCDQSTPCLQTTAEPNPARAKGRLWAADRAPGLGPGSAVSSTSPSRRVMRPLRAPASHSRPRGHSAVPRPGVTRGLPAFGMGTHPGGDAGKPNLGCENPVSHA